MKIQQDNAIEQGSANYSPRAKSCFLYGLQVKNSFCIFNGWQKVKRIFHDMWTLYKIQISVFINKDSLEPGYTHLFTYYL